MVETLLLIAYLAAATSFLCGVVGLVAAVCHWKRAPSFMAVSLVLFGIAGTSAAVASTTYWYLTQG